MRFLPASKLMMYKVCESTYAISLPIRIDIEFNSRDSCISDGVYLRRKFAKAWSFATLVGCKEVRDGAVGTFKVGSALVYQADRKRPSSNYPLYLGLNEDNGRIALAYMQNDSSLTSLIAAINEVEVDPNEEHKPAGYRYEELAALSAELKGSDARDVDVVISDVFWDGEPVADVRKFTLARQAKTEMLLNNVATSSLGLSNYALIATFPMP